MTAAPDQVFRTTDPEVIQAHNENVLRHVEWRRKVRAYLEGIPQAQQDKMWEISYPSNDCYIEGLYVETNRDVPVGWRRTAKKPTCIVPNRRTPDGKAAYAEFQKVRQSPRDLDLPGMPRQFSVRDEQQGTGNIYFHGVELLSPATLVPIGGSHLKTIKEPYVLEVGWGAKIDADKVGPQWESIPLSQWHAEREAQENG